MPRQSSTHNFLSGVDRFPTSFALLCGTELLRKLGGVCGGRGAAGWVGLSHFDAKSLSGIGAQAASSLPVPVSLGAVLPTVAGFAVYLGLMGCHCGAVQGFPAYHADETRLVEASAVTLYLFSVVNRLAASSALGTSTQVWHCSKIRVCPAEHFSGGVSGSVRSVRTPGPFKFPRKIFPWVMIDAEEHL